MNAYTIQLKCTTLAFCTVFADNRKEAKEKFRKGEYEDFYQDAVNMEKGWEFDKIIEVDKNV